MERDYIDEALEKYNQLYSTPAVVETFYEADTLRAVTARLPDFLVPRADALAKVLGTSRNELIIRGLSMYVNQVSSALIENARMAADHTGDESYLDPLQHLMEVFEYTE